jgi:nucleotide-binding universal stress UspA family protein
METILCPTDFSPGSENAIRYAGELAQRMASRIVLFHSICEPVGTEFVSYSGETDPDPLPDPGYRQEQQRKLKALKSDLENTEWGMPIAYRTLVGYGLPQETIPQVARRVQADMIVLGKESTEGLKQLLTGSVMAGVLKSTSCPVLIIPPRATFRQIHRIVFATDLQGEPFTDVAFVTKLAGLFAAEILLLHILTDNAPDTRQPAQAGLDLLLKRLTYKNAYCYLENYAHIEEGISQFCRRHHADMLVMGYHPHHFWQQVLAQDHTQQMAYHATLPLLVFHYRQ